jgi:hypothetical protein
MPPAPRHCCTLGRSELVRGRELGQRGQGCVIHPTPPQLVCGEEGHRRVADGWGSLGGGCAGPTAPQACARREMGHKRGGGLGSVDWLALLCPGLVQWEVGRGGQSCSYTPGLHTKGRGCRRGGGWRSPSRGVADVLSTLHPSARARKGGVVGGWWEGTQSLWNTCQHVNNLRSSSGS